jgi:hypothetical protein
MTEKLQRKEIKKTYDIYKRKHIKICEEEAGSNGIVRKTLKEETILFSLLLDFVAVVVEEWLSRKNRKEVQLKEAA